MATTDRVHHPVTSVLTAVISEVAYLIQTELRLARTELGEKFGQYVNGGILLGAALALFLPGLVVLLLGIARWLAIAGLPEEWSRLAGNLRELSDRLTPGQVFDEMLAYAKGGGGTFLNALSHAARDNPIPSLLIGAGLLMFLSEKTGLGPMARNLSAEREVNRG